MLLRTPLAIDDVAERIERAYLRKFPRRKWGGPDPRFWGLIARALIEAHRAEPWLPLDPEFFVACQPPTSSLTDPWVHLSPDVAMRRYRRRILRIVDDLQSELCDEIRRIDEQVEDEKPLEAVLRKKSRKVSALARYLVAIREGRPDLAELFRIDAEEQHAGCPLYRRACLELFPEAPYPVVDLVPGIPMTRRFGPVRTVENAN